MKKYFNIYLSALFLFFTGALMAQGSGGTVTKTDEGVTVFELKTPIQGFLPPQLNLSEIIDMPSPPEGLMVYNTTKNEMCYFNGTIWVDMLGNEMLEVGDVYGGGIVFYLDGKGHGLVCAEEDLGSEVQWLKGSNKVTGATSPGLDTGQVNTKAIVDVVGKGKYAASLCINLKVGEYDDWFLPSKDELNLMHQNIGNGNAKGLGNVGGFARSFYWSSTEVDEGKAWMQDFSNGNQLQMMKDYQDYARAIRAF